MFLQICALSLVVDPLFFYIPVVDGVRKCLDLDDELRINASVLRTIGDVLYIIRIIFKFRTAFIAPPSHVFGRGELIDDPRVIARRYLCKNFFIDILVMLPIPQIITIKQGPVSLVTKDWLKYIVLSQYVARVIRIVTDFKQVTRSSNILAEVAWVGAASKLFMYLLASHGIGALWYLISIERLHRCWRNAIDTDESVLYCNKLITTKDQTLEELLSIKCSFISADDLRHPVDMDFGIFIEALESGIVETRKFRKRLYYCFWWGLRNLISFGQNLQTSTFEWEMVFAIAIAIAIGGLILFSLLIGNMQKYQDTTERVEEMRKKRQVIEQWMSQRMLPKNLRERIRRYEQYKWKETKGVDEETLIANLPKYLRRDIKRHLCLNLLKRVPMFEKMDEQLLDAICDRLKSVLYTDNSYIVREGNPVKEMLFIIRGELLSVTTGGGRTGFFNSCYHKAGDFCGDELLTWAIDPHPLFKQPISSRTVRALKEVQAFVLMADDLKFVASQFRRIQSKQFQHIFRFYSEEWRIWAASFIQAAWRRHCKRKLARSLLEAEEELQQASTNERGIPPSFGATIYASRFIVKALQTLRDNGSQSARLPQMLLPSIPQKPGEPDFTAEVNYN